MADLEIMVFHFWRHLKVVADLDKMSYQGTQQSMNKDSSTSSASSTSTLLLETSDSRKAGAIRFSKD